MNIFTTDFWLAFMLPSATSLAVFYLFYKVLVRNDTHLKSRRFLILGLVIFAVALPFLNFQIATNMVVGNVGIENFRPLQKLIYELPVFTLFGEVNTVGNDVGASTKGSLGIFDLIGWIYLFVVLFLVGRGFVGVLRLAAFSGKGKRHQTEGATIISCSNIPTAFSFFKTVFIPETLENTAEREMVLRHEQAHVKQKHSWDLMLMEMVCVLQFFNPFAWLLKREMRLNHEYLADREALKNNENPEQYFQLLLRELVGAELAISTKLKQPVFVHSFHYSPLKNRIMMQLSKPAKALNHVRYLAFVPVVLVLTFLFACQEKSTISQEDSEYIFLNAEQLKPLGLHLSEKGLFYANINPNSERDGENFPLVMILNDGENFTTSISLQDIPDNFDRLSSMIKGEKITRLDLTVRLVGNPSGSFGFDRTDRGDEMLVPIAVRMAETGISNRTDTVVFWFRPNETLQKALPKGINMEHFLKFPPARLAKVEGSPILNMDDSHIFQMVDEHPNFPGGNEARMRFLQENVRYPAKAREKGIQGTVFATFVVEKDGSITDVRILRGIGGGCDEEVVRIVQMMPRWIPGRHGGKPVRVQFNMPIRFVLGDENPPA